MAEDEFYWDTFFVKVCDYFFNLRRAVKVRIETFVLCLKDEFACLLKVVYPRYVHTMFMFHLSLSCVDFWHLKKEEWVSVLKLSTIWNMTKVC